MMLYILVFSHFLMVKFPIRLEMLSGFIAHNSNFLLGLIFHEDKMRE